MKRLMSANKNMKTLEGIKETLMKFHGFGFLNQNTNDRYSLLKFDLSYNFCIAHAIRLKKILIQPHRLSKADLFLLKSILAAATRGSEEADIMVWKNQTQKVLIYNNYRTY